MFVLYFSLDDSIISQSSDVSMPSGLAVVTDDVVSMLSKLSKHVSDIQCKVCESLRRKYISILSSDDTTQGLGNHVILQFTYIRPLFDELEKVGH